MSQPVLRHMERREWSEVADLISVSMNHWDVLHGSPGRFAGGPAWTMGFCETYELLDPGRCLVAVHPDTERIMGSCFYRERETHVSLGIMNVHPNYMGQGVARRLLDHVTSFQDDTGKPLRLVASAMNLDSFSLYTRSGFVPRRVYQDLLVQVPDDGLAVEVSGAAHVRAGTVDDVEAMAQLELDVSGISRRHDYRFFLENRQGIWHTSVVEHGGRIDAFLASMDYNGMCMIGPGVARTEADALPVIRAELNARPGRFVLLLVPVECTDLVRFGYAIGGRNCEMHLAEIRGDFPGWNGVTLPTFLPESM
jgi:GNAT superfamily N-acetyltransferase